MSATYRSRRHAVQRGLHTLQRGCRRRIHERAAATQEGRIFRRAAERPGITNANQGGRSVELGSDPAGPETFASCRGRHCVLRWERHALQRCRHRRRIRERAAAAQKGRIRRRAAERPKITIADQGGRSADPAGSETFAIAGAADAHYSGVATAATFAGMLPIISGGSAAAPPSAQGAALCLVLRACCAKLCLMQGNWPDRADWKRRPLPRESRRRWRAKSLPAHLEYTQRVTTHSEFSSQETCQGREVCVGAFIQRRVETRGTRWRHRPARPPRSSWTRLGTPRPATPASMPARPTAPPTTASARPPRCPVGTRRSRPPTSHCVPRRSPGSRRPATPASSTRRTGRTADAAVRTDTSV